MSAVISSDAPADARGRGAARLVLAVTRLLLAVSCVMIAAALWLVFANVVLRYLFNAPFIWADQFTSYLLFYMTFLAAPWVLAVRAHVSIEIVRSMVRPRRQKWMDALGGVVTAVYFALFTWLGIGELVRVVQRHAQFADAVEFPQWVIYAALPVGTLLLTLQALVNAAQDFAQLRASHD